LTPLPLVPSLALVSRRGYAALEREARRRGRLDQTTMFQEPL
jgi:hypothetical protein